MVRRTEFACSLFPDRVPAVRVEDAQQTVQPRDSRLALSFSVLERKVCRIVISIPGWHRTSTVTGDSVPSAPDKIFGVPVPLARSTAAYRTDSQWRSLTDTRKRASGRPAQRQSGSSREPQDLPELNPATCFRSSAAAGKMSPANTKAKRKY